MVMYRLLSSLPASANSERCMPPKKDHSVHFSRTQVMKHIGKCHPLCPVDVQEKIIYRIVTRSWSSLRIGRAFGIVSENFVRHELTSYESLMKKHHLTREEARHVVASQVRDIIQSWSAEARAVDRDEASDFPIGTQRYD